MLALDASFGDSSGEAMGGIRNRLRTCSGEGSSPREYRFTVTRGGQGLRAPVVSQAPRAGEFCQCDSRITLTCKHCQVQMTELKGHIYHKKRKWKCLNAIA